MDKIRLAIVGCGNISQLNAPGYLQHPQCDVVALCDTDRAKAETRVRQPQLDAQTSKSILQVPLAIYEAAQTGCSVQPDAVT